VFHTCARRLDEGTSLGNLAESRDGGRSIASFSTASNFATATTIASRPAGQLRVVDISCAIAHLSVSPVLRHHRGIRSLCPDSLSISVTGESPLPPQRRRRRRRRRDHATATRSSRFHLSFLAEHLLPSYQIRWIKASRPTPWAIALPASAIIAGARLTRYVCPRNSSTQRPRGSRKNRH
jgi:hypothetical protein